MLELSLRYGSGLVFWVFCLVASRERERLVEKLRLADAERGEIVGQLARAQARDDDMNATLTFARARVEQLEGEVSRLAAQTKQTPSQPTPAQEAIRFLRAADSDRSRPTFASGGFAFDTLRDAGPPADRIHDRARRGINEEF